MKRYATSKCGRGKDESLLVWEGDQSNLDRCKYAKALNTPAVARRFGAQMNQGVHA